MKHDSRGLTLVEVLIAMTILGVVVAVLSTATVSSVRNTAASGGRTQATQVLNYMGRLVAGSDRVLFSREGLTWDYGELRPHFQELSAESGRANPDLYRVEVAITDTVTLASVAMPLYTIDVCWMAPGGESCVTAQTIGPEVDTTEEMPGTFPGIG